MTFPPDHWRLRGFGEAIALSVALVIIYLSLNCIVIAEEKPAGRIRNTEKLLRAAALIMSVLLLSSSVVTTVLIPAEAMQSGHSSGRAGGRVSRRPDGRPSDQAEKGPARRPRVHVG